MGQPVERGAVGPYGQGQVLVLLGLGHHQRHQRVHDEGQAVRVVATVHPEVGDLVVARQALHPLAAHRGEAVRRLVALSVRPYQEEDEAGADVAVVLHRLQPEHRETGVKFNPPTFFLSFLHCFLASSSSSSSSLFLLYFLDLLFLLSPFFFCFLALLPLNFQLFFCHTGRSCVHGALCVKKKLFILFCFLPNLHWHRTILIIRNIPIPPPPPPSPPPLPPLS